MAVRLLQILLFAVLIFSHPVVAHANATLDDANTALIQGKHKVVVKLVGQVVAEGKQKPAVMARALLLRGIAYRNMGKISQAIADFSNSEWLQKLKGVELRRLYAERALAYEAVGQKELAAKDRRLAGSSSIEAAKSIQSGVRVTSLNEKSSNTSEFFGGLGNLFGFGNQKPKPVIKTKVVAKKSDPGLREIPTLDSAEAQANRAKLEGKPVPDAAIEAAKIKADAKPSNSAWVARKDAKVAATKKAATKLKAGEKEVLPWQVGQVDQGDQIKQLALNNNKQPANAINSTPKAQTGLDGPVSLTPAKVKEESSGNAVTSFFQNIFTGSPAKKEQPPVTPGDDVISADQVASLQPGQKVSPVTRKPVKKAPVKKAAARKPVKRPAAKKKVAANTNSRSLYHVQLGVFGEAQAADKFVSRLNKKFGPVVGSKTAMVVETDLGQSRRQYRVYLGPFRSREKGIKSCKTLTRLGMGCSLVE
ncbi:MAG: hypothetical protein DHS20C08_06030 [Rhodomicrobium sp.]|nr:MAG: hypothetical protein DHS20C08_06030 [Rhodomicrobium sp.]